MNEPITSTLESEAGFRVLFQYATIGIVVVGKNGHIQIINPSAEGLFGYKNSELINRPLEILIPDDPRKKHVSYRESYFSTPKSRPMGYGISLYARKKDGTVFPVEISLGHYELEGEKMAVAFITDITKRKETEQKLIKINAELERRVAERTNELSDALEKQKQVNDMKSRFVSIASHEFRTPLSAILSSVSLIDQYIGTPEHEKKKKHVERIRSSVKNMTGILNDFLSLDKLEQNKIDIEEGDIDLDEFINDIIEEVTGILKSGQQVTYTHSGNTRINQDKKILRNILLNLLSNAIKYSEENKQISVITEAGSSTVKISVKDNGIGIPLEEQKHLFDKFFRAKNAGNIQGTGLGLNIVKRYVELLKGTIQFESNPGSGTVFMVELSKNLN